MKIIRILIIFLFIPTIVFASEQADIKAFTGEIKKYSSDIFPEFSDENWIQELMNRREVNRGTRYHTKNRKFIIGRI